MPTTEEVLRAVDVEYSTVCQELADLRRRYDRLIVDHQAQAMAIRGLLRELRAYTAWIRPLEG